MPVIRSWPLWSSLLVAACQAAPGAVGAQVFARPDGEPTVTEQPYDLALRAEAADTLAPYPFNRFIVSLMTLRAPTGQRFYVHSGSFRLGADRRIVHAATGYPLDPPVVIPADATDVHIRADGLVMIRRDGAVEQEEVGLVAATSFQEPTRLVAAGNGLYGATADAGLMIAGRPANGSQNELVQGILLP